MHRRISVAVAALVVALTLGAVPTAGAIGNPEIAALQVGLIDRQLYVGPVDGIAGPATSQALREFQRSVGLSPSGALDPSTRAALGTWASPELGLRTLRLGMSGWDVAELQFMLAWHGFPSGLFTGVFESHVEAALLRFQRSARLSPDGVAGPATIAALHSPISTCPIRLAWPLQAPISSSFGPRAFGFHSGVDLAAPAGTPVAAAAAGRVTWAAFLAGGWGNLAVVTSRSGVQTLYAHLSEIDVMVGQRVAVGARLGLVGATGDVRGAHLHFEVRVRGAAVDPLPALPAPSVEPAPAGPPLEGGGH